MKNIIISLIIMASLTMCAPAELQPKAYEELPIGAIKADGWLQDMLLRQNKLTSQMDVLYSEVMGARNGWLGGDGDQWERGPYWIDGALPLAYLLNDEALKAKIQPWIEWTIDSQTEEGFFGPSVDYPAEPGLQRSNAKDWWPRMVMLKVLKQHYLATGDERILPFLTKYFHYQLNTLSETPLGNWTSWAEYRACDNLEVVLWLYNITSDKKLLELADILHAQSFDYTGQFLGSDLLRRQSSIHCVNLAQGLKEPVIYWQKSGDPKHIAAVKKGLADIKEFNGFPNGMYGGDELLHGNVPTQGSELCSAVELMYSLELMTQITGDLDFVDHLERIAYNALPTQITDDFMGRQYFQQSNQVEISRNLRNFDINHGETDLVFGLLSGYPCCSSNLHQAWPKFTQNLWYKTPDGGLAALVYAPSKLELEIGGAKLSIVEKTCYPFEDKISFELAMDKEALSFPLHLRIPSWTTDEASLLINGSAVEVTAPGSVTVIDREWKSGDVIELALPMPLRSSEWYERSVAVERGPLVYALKIEEDWQLKEFPAKSPYGKTYWEVYPKSDWNYGLMAWDKMEDSFELFVDEEKLASGAFFWNPENVPISIKAKAKQIDSWKLYNHSAGPQPYGYSKYSLRDIAEEAQEITLIPYGATTLRITQFPLIYK